MPRTIHVAHSPDSDDAFMFYALAEGKLDTGDLRYVHELSDIESLNQRALARGAGGDRRLDPRLRLPLATATRCLGSGSSMGDGYGPRLVAHAPAPADPRAALRGLRVAVPGHAHHRLSRAPALPAGRSRPVVIPFDQIEDAVERGEVDVGLLIHEGQLTYADSGLHLWADLGAWWLEETGLPLPLGGNVVRRDLGRRRSSTRSPATSGPASCTPWSTGPPRWRTPSSTTAASATSAPTPSSGCT